ELSALFPHAGLDVRVAALIGMAAMFAGASRALLASIVFAFETTLQPFALLPLAAGCTAAYLVSSLLMKETIMTEKITRRGIAVPADYAADFLSQILVRDVATYKVVSLEAGLTLGEVRSRIELPLRSGRPRARPPYMLPRRAREFARGSRQHSRQVQRFRGA